MKNINEIVDRKNQIRTLPAPRQYVKQRMAQAAEELNRAGDMAVHVEIANEAITKFTHLLYTKDSDGAYANLDNRTGRIIVPAPWGNAGWKAWGLRNWESVVLRGVLMARLVDKVRPCLYEYNQTAKRWHLNTSDYGTLQAATFYLERQAIKLAEWRLSSAEWHNDRVTIQSAHRKRRSTR